MPANNAKDAVGKDSHAANKAVTGGRHHNGTRVPVYGHYGRNTLGVPDHPVADILPVVPLRGE